jgi:hypothetical protein
LSMIDAPDEMVGNVIHKFWVHRNRFYFFKEFTGR